MNNFSFPIIKLNVTDSTNTYLTTLIKKQKVDEFTTAVASFQQSGRGQEGNSWESDNGKNLLFSYVLYPTFCPANKQFYLSQLVSLGIKETLDKYTNGISIKWPNDIYWNDCKICGILIEHNLYGTEISQTIAGIGLNINQSSFHSDAPNPISLLQITGKEHNLDEILSEILARTSFYYQALREGKEKDIAKRYFNALYRKDGFYTYKDINGTFKAKIKDILPYGTLILIDTDNNQRQYNFKEVQFIL
jgi:BirA family biotin operon repressor/biotin-[acetyl-CoA-carboxylase] ligase